MDESSTWNAIALTLQLSAATTVVLWLLATPLAWWLARTHSRWRGPVAALATLPLVLPPTVLGFYLLLALSPTGPIGRLHQLLGGSGLAFTFTGLLIGSVIYSLPFAVQPLQRAFEDLGDRPLEMAATLGASPLDTFFSVVLPSARPAFFTAGLLTFAHTVGEFGVVLMIGGNIPGQTQVVSTQIYRYVEATEYAQAHALAAGLMLFSFVVLSLLAWVQPRSRTRWWHQASRRQLG